jgi:hypothetical protein
VRSFIELQMEDIPNLTARLNMDLMELLIDSVQAYSGGRYTAFTTFTNALQFKKADLSHATKADEACGTRCARACGLSSTLVLSTVNCSRTTSISRRLFRRRPHCEYHILIPPEKCDAPLEHAPTLTQPKLGSRHSMSSESENDRNRKLSQSIFHESQSRHVQLDHTGDSWSSRAECSAVPRERYC